MEQNQPPVSSPVFLFLMDLRKARCLTVHIGLMIFYARGIPQVVDLERRKDKDQQGLGQFMESIHPEKSKPMGIFGTKSCLVNTKQDKMLSQKRKPEQETAQNGIKGNL
ncbi:hypothetical protein TNIN_2711 [Trichonephila inaurata madagascariensis]|uniref:Uncharacterized protein n=1 Tax=Trichonephila inaurata madagascariensis TaxID=2747483 RepID=A0A8X7BYT6_9ARAC|nr:hypothetical protein TNIN_2711 [Trichonephila inaurata madagascariensis]